MTNSSSRIANPWSPLAEEYLAPRFPDLEIVKIVTLASEINRAIESVATNNGPSRSELEAIDVEDMDDGIHDFDVTTDYTEPMAQLIATIMADAVRTRASDIHFKVEKETFYYAFRVDGDIGNKVEIPMKLKDRLDAFLLNLMKLPTEIRNTAPGISGRFTISYFHRPIDIRYERHRTYRGYHVTMRLLDKSNINVTLGKGTLAFDDETMFALNKVMKIPAGIIVMSGPTGSGKSTTLNAILRELNRPEVNILTLENPVEDEVPGITHCDLQERQGVQADDRLVHALRPRHHPDGRGARPRIRRTRHRGGRHRPQGAHHHPHPARLADHRTFRTARHRALEDRPNPQGRLRPAPGQNALPVLQGGRPGHQRIRPQDLLPR